MKALRRGWKRLGGLFGRKRRERELSEELATHIAMQTEDNVRAGMDPETAARHARIKFGSVPRATEEYRSQRGLSGVETLVSDMRYGVRALVRTPGFTIVAILTLALGVGANSAMFSVVNTVLLAPLPYDEPDRLMRVVRKAGQYWLTVPELEFWKENSRSLVGMAGYRNGGTRQLQAGGEEVPVLALRVTSDFLRALGVRPLLGRDFLPAETVPGAGGVVVIGYDLWQQRFSADPGIVGRTIIIDGLPNAVVGVLPEDFWFPEAADLLLPLRPAGGSGDLGYNTAAIARLDPATTTEQALGEMDVLTQGFRERYPDVEGNLGLGMIPFHEVTVQNVRLNLLILFSGTALLLAIACSNLISLMVARHSTKVREIAVRLALGSSRTRLLGQFFIENMILTAAGAVVALGTAHLMLTGFLSSAPFALPSSRTIGLDPAAVALTGSVALGITLLLTLTPLWIASRLNLNEAMKAGARTATSTVGHQRTRSSLVIAKVAFTTMLLVGAGLVIQSLYLLSSESLGFATGDRITFNMPVDPVHRQTAPSLSAYAEGISGRLRGLPGVSSAEAINVFPLSGFFNLPTQREGLPDQSIGGMEIRVVTPDFLSAVSTPLLAGRQISEEDTLSSESIALVNETVLRSWWSAPAEAIGDRIVIGRFRTQEFPDVLEGARTVVGVVGDTKTTLADPPRSTIYIPMAQASPFMLGSTQNLSWVLESDGELPDAALIEAAVRADNPRQEVLSVRMVSELLSRATVEPRFNAWLFGAFAGIALALSAVGVYGVLASIVTERRSEIGIRMALGARAADVMSLVLGKGLLLTAGGWILGLLMAVATTRYLAGLLFGVQPRDLTTLVLASTVLFLAALAACSLPARRAARMNPVVALRNE